MFSWVKSGNFLSKVVERTKTMSENVITTLDPQMKEFIKSGGDVAVVVASDKEAKVAPVREAFQAVFGQATVGAVRCSAVQCGAGVGSAGPCLQHSRAAGGVRLRPPGGAGEGRQVGQL
jgi:hypothetical protein